MADSIEDVTDEARVALGELAEKLSVYRANAFTDSEALADLLGLRDELVSLNVDFADGEADEPVTEVKH